MKHKIPFRKQMISVLTLLTVLVVVVFGISIIKANVVLVKRNVLGDADRFFESFQKYPETSSIKSEFTETVPVLLYHGINDPIDRFTLDRGRFREHMSALYEKGYRTITAEDFVAFMKGEKKLPARSFLLTFDDGRKDSFYGADPVLERLGYHAVMFIAPAQSLEQSSLSSDYYLNKLEIHQMLQTGRWEIQSHTLQTSGGFIPIDANGKTGYFLSNKKWIKSENRLETDSEYDTRVKHEIVDSVSAIQDVLGVKVNLMSYPFSDFGQHTENNTKDAVKTIRSYVGDTYSYAFMQQWPYDGGFIGNHSTDDPLYLRRIEPASDWTGKYLVEYLLSGEDVVSLTNGIGLSLQSMNSRWRKAWGDTPIFGDDGITIKTSKESPSTLVLFDGSRAWSDYRFDTEISFDGNGTIGLYGNVNGIDDAVRCIWDKKNMFIERIINDEVVSRQVFSAQEIRGKHTYSIVSKPGYIGCYSDSKISGAFRLDASLVGGVGIELHSFAEDSTLKIVNTGVTFSPSIDVKTLKEESEKSIRSLTQNTSLDFLKKRLVSAHSQVRSYADGADGFLIPGLFSQEVWGGDTATFATNISENSFSLDHKKHVSGEVYWMWPKIAAKGNEYEIQATYIASTSTELTVKSELQDGTVVWSVVREMPPVKVPTKYSFAVELPKGTVAFSVLQTMRDIGTLTIQSPRVTELKEGSFDKGYISFSFDDGYETFKTNAAPILTKAQVPATLAVITSHTAFDRYLKPADLHDIEKSSNEIADHTRNHSRLDTSLTMENLIQEVAGSKYDLTTAGFNPKVFVYPYGGFSLDAVSVIKDAGFIGARSSIRGFNTKNTDHFYLKDQIIEKTTTMDEIERYMRTASEERKWLILELHNVYSNDDFKDEEGITSEKLEAIIQMAQKYRLEPITLTQGLQKMGAQ